MTCPFIYQVLIAMATAGLLAPIFSPAQSPAAKISTAVLLEVIATHTTPEHEDKFVYLRVSSDRTAECESSKDGDGGKNRPMTKKTLKESDFIQIKSATNDTELTSLRPEYETRYAIVDSWTEWAIKIQRTGKPQFIKVLEFSPGLAKTMGHPYPRALTRLGCNIEKIRSDVTSEGTTIRDECRSILGLKGEAK